MTNWSAFHALKGTGDVVGNLNLFSEESSVKTISCVYANILIFGLLDCLGVRVLYVFVVVFVILEVFVTDFRLMFTVVFFNTFFFDEDGVVFFRELFGVHFFELIGGVLLREFLLVLGVRFLDPNFPTNVFFKQPFRSGSSKSIASIVCTSSSVTVVSVVVLSRCSTSIVL
jgi:hypothetical protein